MLTKTKGSYQENYPSQGCAAGGHDWLCHRLLQGQRSQRMRQGYDCVVRWGGFSGGRVHPNTRDQVCHQIGIRCHACQVAWRHLQSWLRKKLCCICPSAWLHAICWGRWDHPSSVLVRIDSSSRLRDLSYFQKNLKCVYGQVVVAHYPWLWGLQEGCR